MEAAKSQRPGESQCLGEVRKPDFSAAGRSRRGGWSPFLNATSVEIWSSKPHGYCCGFGAGLAVGIATAAPSWPRPWGAGPRRVQRHAVDGGPALNGATPMHRRARSTSGSLRGRGPNASQRAKSLLTEVRMPITYVRGCGVQASHPRLTSVAGQQPARSVVENLRNASQPSRAPSNTASAWRARRLRNGSRRFQVSDCPPQRERRPASPYGAPTGLPGGRSFARADLAVHRHHCRTPVPHGGLGLRGVAFRGEGLGGSHEGRVFSREGCARCQEERPIRMNAERLSLVGGFVPQEHLCSSARSSRLKVQFTTHDHREPR